MNEILAKCGYRCDLCPAYSENIKSEEDKKIVSDGWKRMFGFEIPPEEVACAGCHNKGNHPDSDCPVRPCVIEKGMKNCAYCENFECDSLKTRTGFLAEYFKKSICEISTEDYEKYILPYESRERLVKIRNMPGTEK